MPGDITRYIQLANQLLDVGYTQQAGALIRAIANNSRTGRLAKSLEQLDAEAERLIAAGERMTGDNPVLRAVLADFNDVMTANRVLLESNDEAVQAVGQRVAEVAVRQQAVVGMTEQQARGLLAEWLRPSPDAVAELINYTAGDQWRDRLTRYGEGVPEVVNRMAQRGIISGWNPRKVAREVRRGCEQLPARYAEQTMRTLMNTSYRDAATAQRVANSHIIEYHVRIAAADDRTCLACLALDGTRLENDERVNDHHNGRCSSVPKVKGFPLPAWQHGREWFAAQSEDTQRAMMGKARFEAFRDGAIGWDDMHRAYDDAVFGQMVGEASLRGILGSEAERYMRHGKTA